MSLTRASVKKYQRQNILLQRKDAHHIARQDNTINKRITNKS